nr:uncharacterized protein LOC118971669 [Manis javanica]
MAAAGRRRRRRRDETQRPAVAWAAGSGTESNQGAPTGHPAPCCLGTAPPRPACNPPRAALANERCSCAAADSDSRTRPRAHLWEESSRKRTTRAKALSYSHNKLYQASQEDEVVIPTGDSGYPPAAGPEGLPLGQKGSRNAGGRIRQQARTTHGSHADWPAESWPHIRPPRRSSRARPLFRYIESSLWSRGPAPSLLSSIPCFIRTLLFLEK